MVTLKDIAREANVSVMTVSNVVNGQPVQGILRESGTDSGNHPAAQLCAKRQRAQPCQGQFQYRGYQLRNIGNENALSGPHNAALVGQMIRLLQAGGFLWRWVSLVETKADIAKTLRAWNVRGAVFLGMFDDEIEQIYAASKAPMVFVTATATCAGLQRRH